MIGQRLAQGCQLVIEHAIKQADRLRSNQGIDVWVSFARRVPQLIGYRQRRGRLSTRQGGEQAWCLAASEAEASTKMLVNYLAKRWTIELGFRDIKDLRFGMGLSATRIGEPTRCDRLLQVNAFALALLTISGAAG